MGRCHGDRGAVTVEAAIGMVALVAVLAMALAGFAAVIDQLRCTDAAREVARLAARGERERAGEVVSRIAPPGARWELRTEAGGITAVVHAGPVRGLLPGIRLRAEAFAIPEPGVASAGTRRDRGAPDERRGVP
ncbi:MAG: pilus assembly protein [Actinophytocola sp.]|nr:pilus assembly protein [Actinophytocola sp.]